MATHPSRTSPDPPTVVGEHAEPTRVGPGAAGDVRRRSPMRWLMFPLLLVGAGAGGYYYGLAQREYDRAVALLKRTAGTRGRIATDAVPISCHAASRSIRLYRAT